MTDTITIGSKWTRRGTDKIFTVIKVEGNFVYVKGTRESQINKRNFVARYQAHA